MSDDKGSIHIGGNVGNQNVIGHNNTINQAPDPEIRVLGSQGHPQADGSISWVVSVDIVSPFAVPKPFRVEVSHPTLFNLRVRPVPWRTMMNVWAGDGFFQVPGAHGRYDVEFATRSPEQPHLNFGFVV